MLIFVPLNPLYVPIGESGNPSDTDNGLGEFEIGISEIGVNQLGIPIFDFNTTLISQYANSPILYQLIENIASYLYPIENIDSFFEWVWNIDTAQGFGLDILGRIVGVSRVLQVISGTSYFSFAGTNPNGEFGQAPFYSGQPLTGNYALSDSAFRTLILAKALANISDCSVPSINKLLQLLFPNRGVAYVIDNENMSITYKFNFPLSLVEQSIVVNSGVLPRPSGVAVSYSY